MSTPIPDELTSATDRIPIQLIGLPGTWNHVPYFLGNEREPRTSGSVTVILARPDSLPDPRWLRSASEIEGDSHIAICRPATEVDVPTRRLTFELYDESQNTVILLGLANPAGYLGKFVLLERAEANVHFCEIAAMQIILPIMSQLSYQNDVPLFVWQIHVAPAGTAQIFVRVAVPFLPKRNGNRHHLVPSKFFKVTSAYREGLSLIQISPLFAFLLFYRVIEACTSLRTIPETSSPAVKQRIPGDWEQIRTWLAESLSMPPPSLQDALAVVPEEALGKKYRWIINELREIRNRVAHGLVDENQEISSVDDPVLRIKVGRWMTVCRCLARAALTEVGGLQEIEFGLPPAIAIEQLTSRTERASGNDEPTEL